MAAARIAIDGRHLTVEADILKKPVESHQGKSDHVIMPEKQQIALDDGRILTVTLQAYVVDPVRAKAVRARMLALAKAGADKAD